MYAIVKTSGTQFKVEPGTVLEVNRMAGNPGDVVTLDSDVLLVKTDSDMQVGNPTVANASVELEILEHYRGKKVIVFKMKRRKRYRNKQGHRQELTKVQVKDIKLG